MSGTLTESFFPEIKSLQPNRRQGESPGHLEMAEAGVEGMGVSVLIFQMEGTDTRRDNGPGPQESAGK